MQVWYLTIHYKCAVEIQMHYSDPSNPIRLAQMMRLAQMARVEDVFSKRIICAKRIGLDGVYSNTFEAESTTYQKLKDF